MPFFSSQGATLHYQVFGHGLPLYFIHPPSMGAATFLQQRDLAREFQVVLLDARGHSFSSDGIGTLSIAEWAQDIHELANVLGHEQIVLCGYSSGSSVALEHALNWPERTAGVVLTGAFPEVCTTLLQKEFETGIWIARNNLNILLSQMLSYSNSKTKQHRDAIAETVKGTNPLLVQSLYESGLFYNCTWRLPQLTVPMLLVYGAHDWYVHYYQYLFYKYALHAPKDVVLVGNVGHQVPTLEPDTYNAVVKRFANDLQQKNRTLPS
ncbi:Pimeloyl-ACP methyl ester carboxylesterase [Alteribacillus persepolensis]|uniref:Pimeloyl-ACP methyl ester carboxylesterase n=1 Tax=Alteribacillus persepolensis TaxID=568899 RepID=A0A1G8G2P4_9BACI|nr:alpha/beta hydrolase [Alteribacillus persepolensis]SDH88688.1 Pimeloyl-ACP methyl ester carboxylesterase [Alteribacillus persepolensis]